MYVIPYQCLYKCFEFFVIFVHSKEILETICKRINFLWAFPLKWKLSPLVDFYKFSCCVQVFHICCSLASQVVLHETLPFSFLAFPVAFLILEVAQGCPNFQVGAIQIHWVVDALFVDMWLSLFQSCSILNNSHSI